MSTYCRFRLLVLHFTGTSIPRVHGHWDTLKFASAPGLSGGSRGDTPQWRSLMASARLAFLRGAVCACQYAVHQTLSLGPCTAMVNFELPATTVGEVAETPPLARTQGRTVDCSFNVYRSVRFKSHLELRRV